MWEAVLQINTALRSVWRSDLQGMVVSLTWTLGFFAVNSVAEKAEDKDVPFLNFVE